MKKPTVRFKNVEEEFDFLKNELKKHALTITSDSIKKFQDEEINLYNKEQQDFFETRRYDKNNNLIYYKDLSGTEFYYAYDEANNCTYYSRKSVHMQKCIEWWKKYDNKGNLVYSKNSKNFEEWMEYDDLGRIIKYTTKDYSYIKRYDRNGNMVYFKTSDNHEEHREYDNKNNLIYEFNNKGFKKWYSDKYEIVLKNGACKIKNKFTHNEKEIQLEEIQIENLSTNLI